MVKQLCHGATRFAGIKFASDKGTACVRVSINAETHSQMVANKVNTIHQADAKLCVQLRAAGCFAVRAGWLTELAIDCVQLALGQVLKIDKAASACFVLSQVEALRTGQHFHL
eukprot:2768036-Pleurochrysis_carterae.AAC.5